VRDVRHQLPSQPIGLLDLIELRHQPSRHRVEGARQPVDLVPLASTLLRQGPMLSESALSEVAHRPLQLSRPTCDPGKHQQSDQQCHEETHADCTGGETQYVAALQHGHRGVPLLTRQDHIEVAVRLVRSADRRRREHLAAGLVPRIVSEDRQPRVGL
jgi:hypothetical protein